MMINQKFLRVSLVLLGIFVFTDSFAAVPETSYADLHWRQVGPFRGGWATAVAGHPDKTTTFYFGSADGGVWKTDNAGVTWKPLFEQQGSASIGALAIAPSNPDVIWVGTGQIQQRWDIVDGDGVYRSIDGGQNWQHVGLKDTRHIGDLWVDPDDDQIAVVAALGHVFGPNRQRGLFRTEDGGKSWDQVLYLDDTTGAADLAFSPDASDILYASLWQVQRHPWLDYFQPTVGGNSSIYRSVDGGRNWKPVDGAGLPTTPLSRIEIAVAPGHKAQRVWASVGTADGGGLYRSEDGGSSWVLVNDDSSLASDYMSWLTADPKDDNTVWQEIADGQDVIVIGRHEIQSRAYVGRFNFRGPDQEKQVGVLSGGERNRVHMARLLKEGGNVLLLDEPTNDLDVNTMRALEEALENFGGCAVIISHDRWFLDRIATHILAFEGDSEVTFFEGNWSEYEEDRKKRLGPAAEQPHRIKYRQLTR